MILNFPQNSKPIWQVLLEMLGFFWYIYPRGNRLVMPPLMLSIALICEYFAEEKQPKPSDNNYADILNNNPKVQVLRRELE